MEDIKVSVLCIAYNHENYIKSALESFVNQKTDFKFEVIVHDDCSTDNTASIIKEYVAKYPDLIKPIYEEVNQYTKVNSIIGDIMLPYVKGKYIAICEGDDYWIDENKLQIQYDYMENNPDCYCCSHSFVQHNCQFNTDETVILSNDDRDFSLKEIVDGGGGLFATNSLMIKKEVKTTIPEIFNAKGFGDYQMPIYSAILGKVHYINKVMSQYNYMAINSWSARTTVDTNKLIASRQEVVNLLERIDRYYDYKYNADLIDRINATKLEILYIKEDYKSIKKSEFYKQHKDIFDKKRQRIIAIGGFSKPLLKWLLKVKSVFR